MRLRRLAERWEATTVARVWARYAAARGPVLAGGIAYFAFFSLFPAMAVGFTILARVVGDDSQLQKDLVNFVNDSLGATLIGLEPGQGVVSVDTLVQPEVLNVVGLVGLVALLFTGLGWLDAVREGLRAVFGQPRLENMVLRKVLDLFVLAMLGVAVLVSVAASVAAATASTRVQEWLGLAAATGGGSFVRLSSVLALVVVDSAVFLMFFRVLSGVRVPFEHLVRGAVVGSVGLGVINFFSALLLGRLSDNKFLATSSVVVGLLIWMNLVGRLTLVSASWSATRAADAGDLPVAVPVPGTEPARGTEPATGAEPASGRAASTDRGAAIGLAPVPRTASFGQRAQDRVAVAAGVVLGASSILALRLVRGGMRTAIGGIGSAVGLAARRQRGD